MTYQKDTKFDIQIKSSEKLTSEVNTNKATIRPEPPNGGYGWVIVFASFMCSAVVQGTAFSFGTFLVELIPYYQSSSGELAWIGSLVLGTMSCMGPFSSALMSKYGERRVIIAGSFITTTAFLLSTTVPTVAALKFTYGFVGGIGLGLIQLPAVMAVPPYFSTRRGTAIGISMCGSSMGSLLLPALSYFLLQIYGWKGTLYIMSGLVLNCTVFGALIRPLETPRTKQDKLVQSLLFENIESENAIVPRFEKTKDHSNIIPELQNFLHDKERTTRKNCRFEKCVKNFRNLFNNLKDFLGLSFLKQRPFLVLCIANVIIMTGIFIPAVYLPHSSILKGIERNKVALILPIFGAVNLFGRVAFGYISDKFHVRAITINYICLFVSGISSATIPFCTEFTTTIAAVVVYSFSLAGFVSLTPILLVDMVGLEQLPKAFGLICLFRAVPSICGTPLAGYVFDLTSSYDIPYYKAGFLLFSGGLLTAVASYIKPSAPT